MFEKESQFFGEEQVPKSEGFIDSTLENEISLEEKAKTIRDFFELSFKERFPLQSLQEEECQREKEEEDEKAKKWLRDMSLSKIKEVLGGETVEVIWELVSLYKKEMGIEIGKKVYKLAESGGLDMVPVRARRILEIPDHISKWFYLMGAEKIGGFKEGINSNDIVSIIQDMSKWIERKVFPETKPEKEMTIKGFEKFDYPQIKAREFVEKVMQFLPQKILGRNIKSVRYEDWEEPMDEDYGIKGDSGAYYNPLTREIVFLKTDIFSDKKDLFLQGLLGTICHEAGHALDPRSIFQPELSPSEEVEMIAEYEEIRNNEEEFSSYVLKINNKDKKIENYKKSEESFAETIKMFLLNPGWLKDNYLQRFEFCEKWFNRQFPEENFTEIEKIYAHSIYVRSSTLQIQYNNLLRIIKRYEK